MQEYTKTITIEFSVRLRAGDLVQAEDMAKELADDMIDYNNTIFMYANAPVSKTSDGFLQSVPQVTIR